jgi:predicted tellurium resistance membrane protein TerC
MSLLLTVSCYSGDHKRSILVLALIFLPYGIAIHVFLLANMLEKISYLEFSLIAILSFVGLKMLLHEFIEIPEWASLVLLPFLFWRLLFPYE